MSMSIIETKRVCQREIERECVCVCEREREREREREFLSKRSQLWLRIEIMFIR